MAGVTGLAIVDSYTSMINGFPPIIQTSINLLILVLLVVVYSVFVWKFHKFISRKDFLGLNLNQYNKIQHNFFAKLLTSFLYFIEYIIVLPFLVFIWFAVFTFLLMLQSSAGNTSQILIIAAVVIGATRVMAYYNEEPADELAKVLSITLLAVSILNPNTFVESQFIERIITHLSSIPQFFFQILQYLLFIIVLEVILRFGDFIFSLFKIESEEE